MIHTKWIRVLATLAIIVIGGIFLWQYNQVDKPQMVNSDGRTVEKAQVVEIIQDNIQEDGSRVGDQIVSLHMESGPHAGETVQANCPNGLLFGTVCQLGMQVIVISSTIGKLDLQTVYNVDRLLPIYLYIAVFLVLLCIIDGKKRCQIRILFAGILFASLGAVMDIAMDVTSACVEIVKHNPYISRKALFQAGMNVGRDVMGTMSTTLILAFFGGSLGV